MFIPCYLKFDILLNVLENVITFKLIMFFFLQGKSKPKKYVQLSYHVEALKQDDLFGAAISHPYNLPADKVYFPLYPGNCWHK